MKAGTGFACRANARRRYYEGTIAIPFFSMSQPPLHPIAILNLLGDYSFNSYTSGLSEGLGQHGIDVHLYTCGEESQLAELPAPRFHKRLNVLGSLLFQRRESTSVASSGPRPSTARGPGGGTGLDKSWLRKLWKLVRPQFLMHELLWHLRKSGRTILWTQWPEMDPYAQSFWTWAHRYGFLVVHTVHNVLPHEVHPEDRERMRKVYEEADLLWVHSKQSRQLLLQEFPSLDPKNIAIHPIGLYSLFYRRRPDQRESVRQELRIPSDQPMLLACGLIRPYKNLDSVLTALAAPEFSRTVLTIAGRESGFPDSDAADPLRRSRQTVERLGLTDRVRLIPRFLSNEEWAALFEAADALLLPYKEGYGSGLLLMGMTFGKHLLTTPIGGAEEYLAHYPNHTIVHEPDPEHLRPALSQMLSKIHPASPPPEPDLTALKWETVGQRIKEILADRFPA